MKKRLLSIILAIFIIIPCAISLMACNKPADDNGGKEATLDLDFYLNNNLYHTLKMDGSSTVELPTPPSIPNYEFKGWYFKNYSGMMVTQFTEDYFVENNTETNKKVYAKMSLVTTDNSASGAYRISGNYLYMGEYPATYKKDVSLKTTTPDADGYYLGYDGNRYAKVASAHFNKQWSATNFFQNGNDLIKEGETYYFKVEEIKWRILENDGDTALVMPTQILFRHKFQDSKTAVNGIDVRDYKNSDVRAYMNDELIKKIFTAEQRAVILTSWVNNHKDVIGWSGSDSPWQDTYDKLYLPAWSEIKDINYTYRQLLVSDYQRASGMPVFSTELYGGYSGYAYWWLRTRYSSADSPVAVGCASPNGLSAQANVYEGEYGVVPIFRVDL